MADLSFVRTDAGRAGSRRARQTNDCTVRALAIARNIAYDDAYDILKAAGRKCAAKFKMTEWLEDQAWAQGVTFPAIKGEKRMNPGRFCSEHPAGAWICKAAKHVFVVRDGVVYDDYPVREDRCIYRAWKINTNQQHDQEKGNA